MATSDIKKRTFPIVAFCQNASKRTKWFSAVTVLVTALAIVFSEGLMADASLKDDAWATQMVDSIVKGQPGVSRSSVTETFHAHSPAVS